MNYKKSVDLCLNAQKVLQEIYKAKSKKQFNALLGDYISIKLEENEASFTGELALIEKAGKYEREQIRKEMQERVLNARAKQEQELKELNKHFEELKKKGELLSE